MKITVLGAGLVGSAIVKDLTRTGEFDVTVVDLNRAALDRLAAETSAIGVQADLREVGHIPALIAPSDLVICAVPGFMGFATLKAIIEAGKNVVDISFFPEDALELDALAKARGVVAVVDCGVAPGLCNMMAGHVAGLLDKTHSYLCYVGGLPQIRQWPYEYKAVFSPIDVLEEYTRPARLVEYGQVVTRPALSEVELLDFPGAGTLEAFNTDGLRSLIKTMDIPFMKEKTLRFPGHTNLMRIFRESGFFSATLIEVNGQAVIPVAVTSKLLFEQWHMKPGEEDFTVMQVVLEGEKAGQSYRYTYDLLDKYDKPSGVTSMARTTGYTCTLVARQVARGLINQPGIWPPEWVGRIPACFDDLLAGYAERNIIITEQIGRLEQ